MRGKEAALPLPVSSVLGDDDLLREILLRLAFPTCLVHAALVCKRWLRHASDSTFLRRFRKLHPSRILGLYVHGARVCPQPRFVPLPQPPELAVVFRRASFQMGVTDSAWVVDYRNGRLLAVLLRDEVEIGVCSPLQPPRGLNILPPFPFGFLHSANKAPYLVLPEDGGDGLSCILVNLMCKDRRLFAQVYVLQAGAWNDVRTSPSIDLPATWQGYERCSLLVRGKFYMLGQTGYILGLDLVSMTMFFINLPEGVQQNKKNLELSPADDAGFYLIHLKGFKIQVWLYGTDGGDPGNWELVDTICIRQAFGRYANPTWESGDAFAQVYRVEDNAELLFKVEREIFHMNIRSRMVEKIFEMAPDGGPVFYVRPLLMVWPPTFPALNYEHQD